MQTVGEEPDWGATTCTVCPESDAGQTACSPTRDGLTGPLTTLRATSCILLGLAMLLALASQNPGVLLSAVGVVGLIPFAAGAILKVRGRHDHAANAPRERDEDAAIGMPVAALCWQPIVIISDLRVEIFHVGPSTLAAGIAAIALAIYCCSRT